MRHGPAVAALTTAALAAAFAAPAGAQEPLAAATTPAPAAEAAPEPKNGKLTIRTTQDAVLVRSRVKVRGTLQPYVAGQNVIVRFYRGERKLRVVEVKVRRDGKVGRFTVGYAPKKTGRLTVRAVHRETDELQSITAKGVGVDVLPRRVGPGSKGAAVRLLQAKLDRLGYVVGKRGVFDARTARAVLAFRKVTGMARTSEANEAVLRQARPGRRPLQGQVPQARTAHRGRHLTPGAGAHRRGRQGRADLPDVDRRARDAHDPRLVQGLPQGPRHERARAWCTPRTSSAGYAIHGYKSVPTYNASHGCLRVPVPGRA